LPIDRPSLADGWVSVDRGRIQALGSGRPPGGEVEDLGDVALLPGLVNAHTHLELSWMAGRIPPSASMDEWMQAMLALRRAGPDGGDAAVDEAMARAAVAMRHAGTILVGDVSNTLRSPRALRAAGLGGVVFHELLGFNAIDPVPLVREAWARVAAAGGEAPDADPRVSFSVVAHAPYSVAPALIAEIARYPEAAPLSIHLAESPEEIEFLRTGGGPIRRTLERLGVWTDTWRVPDVDPVRFIADLGYLRAGTLIVHGVHLLDADIDRVRRAGAVIVTCPRSNEWIGGGIPRLAHFYATRVPVAIGTDSLASTPTLNLFDELAALRRLAPEVTAISLLDSATRVGAQALGFGKDFGTISPRKRAAFTTVAVPPRTRDVEEYLVSGVSPEQVRVVTA
jgi:cytosine/adenosine deaminase-related metal-dependent hydrolase